MRVKTGHQGAKILDYFKNYTRKNMWVYLMALVLEFIAIPMALWLKIRQFKQVYGIDSRQTDQCH